MEFCEYDLKFGYDHAQICFDTDSCPLCSAFEIIDDLEYDRPYYHQNIYDLTKSLDKHPEGYEGYCRCKYCQERYKQDPSFLGCDCETCKETGFNRTDKEAKKINDNIKEQSKLDRDIWIARYIVRLIKSSEKNEEWYVSNALQTYKQYHVKPNNFTPEMIADIEVYNWSIHDEYDVFDDEDGVVPKGIKDDTKEKD